MDKVGSGLTAYDQLVCEGDEPVAPPATAPGAPDTKGFH